MPKRLNPYVCSESYEPPQKGRSSNSVFSNSALKPEDLGNSLKFLPQTKSITHGIYSEVSCGSNKWIEMANLEALDSVKRGGGPFGAILLQIDPIQNRTIRYWKSSNLVTELNDPTAHAEVNVIRSACESLEVFNLGEINKSNAKLDQPCDVSTCVIYSSCEPCPMCYSAIAWARIPVLYFAATRFDADAPGVGFSDAEFYKELKLPYQQRKIQVGQCNAPNSLDAFNLWKNIEKIEY